MNLFSLYLRRVNWVGIFLLLLSAWFKISVSTWPKKPSDLFSTLSTVGFRQIVFSSRDFFRSLQFGILHCLVRSLFWSCLLQPAVVVVLQHVLKTMKLLSPIAELIFRWVLVFIFRSSMTHSIWILSCALYLLLFAYTWGLQTCKLRSSGPNL